MVKILTESVKYGQNMKISEKSQNFSFFINRTSYGIFLVTGHILQKEYSLTDVPKKDGKKLIMRKKNQNTYKQNLKLQELLPSHHPPSSLIPLF